MVAQTDSGEDAKARGAERLLKALDIVWYRDMNLPLTIPYRGLGTLDHSPDIFPMAQKDQKKNQRGPCDKYP